MRFQIIISLAALLIVIGAANESLAIDERIDLESRTVALSIGKTAEGRIKSISGTAGISEQFSLSLDDSEKYFALAIGNVVYFSLIYLDSFFDRS